MCGGACSYLNGAKAVITIQLLAFTGMMFSIGSLFDCSFVELGQRFFLPEDMDENLPLKVTQTQYIGFLNWKMLDGCVKLCFLLLRLAVLLILDTELLSFVKLFFFPLRLILLFCFMC